MVRHLFHGGAPRTAQAGIPAPPSPRLPHTANCQLPTTSCLLLSLAPSQCPRRTPPHRLSAEWHARMMLNLRTRPEAARDRVPKNRATPMHRGAQAWSGPVPMGSIGMAMARVTAGRSPRLHKRACCPLPCYSARRGGHCRPHQIQFKRSSQIADVSSAGVCLARKSPGPPFVVGYRLF